MLGEEVGAVVCVGLEGFPGNGVLEGKVSGFEAGELAEVAAAAEEFAYLMAVGADVESLGAANVEFDGGEGDVVESEGVDVDEAGFALDDFSLASEFVEGNAVFLHGGDHGRGLVEIAFELGEGIGDLLVGEGGDGAGLGDFAIGVLGVGGFAEFERALVFLVFGHEEVLDFGGFTEEEHEEASGERIEGATVADFFEAVIFTHEIDDIVRGFS